MEEKKYAVVVFTDEDCVSLVPSSWCIDQKTCCWPPYKSPLRFQKAVIAVEKPGSDWTIHAVRVLAMTDSYDDGRMLCIRAEDTSDLQSDAEGPRKRQKRKNRRYISSDDDDDDENDGSITSGNTSYFEDAPAPPPPPQPQTSTPQREGHGSSSLVTNGDLTSTPPSGHVSCSNTTASATRLAKDLRSNQTVGGTNRSAPASQPRISMPSTSTPLPRRVSSSDLSPSALRLEQDPKSNQTVDATNRLMLTLLAQLKSELREIKEQVRANSSILQRLSGSQVEEEQEIQLPDEIQIPVSSAEELKVLDDTLKVDKALQRQLIRRTSVLGGASLKECVKRVLMDLISTTVARKLNWTGASGKVAFSGLILKDIVEKCVRKNPPTASATSSEIQCAVVRFLKGACDRDGGRKSRLAPAADENA